MTTPFPTMHSDSMNMNPTMHPGTELPFTPARHDAINSGNFVNAPRSSGMPQRLPSTAGIKPIDVGPHAPDGRPADFPPKDGFPAKPPTTVPSPWPASSQRDYRNVPE
jgi:hypothetical protein